MKRSSFLKSTFIGAGALALAPISLALATKTPTPLSASVEYKNWGKPIYPELREFWNYGEPTRPKYNLLTYVPNKHDGAGYTICRRTFIFNKMSLKNKDVIVEQEKEAMIEDCKGVLRHPKRYATKIKES